MNLRRMFDEIAGSYTDGGDWCSLDKANALASLVIATRPTTIVEIGVWMGGSALPMLIALRELGAIVDVPPDPLGQSFYGRPVAPSRRRLIAIDPWQASASVANETDEKNLAWWSEVDHEAAYRRFIARLARHEVASLCEVMRTCSDDAPITDEIDLLHVDGNHLEQAFRDVIRYGSRVRVGGYMILDDVGWGGGHVARAVEHAIGPGGFDACYPLGTGIAFQKTRTAAGI